MVDFRNMDCMELMATLEDKSQHLIIVDPPYFEVKGKFDFIWDSSEDYLIDVEKWAKEIKRVMADNGTLFWWGHAKKIAYSQIILDKYFNLENHLKWEKKDCQTMAQDFEQARTYAPVTEHLLMYSNDVLKTGLQEIYDNPNLFLPIKKYMRAERDKLMAQKGFKTISKFNDFINNWTGTSNVVSRHYFADSQYFFPVAKIYKKMQETGFWRKEYEELRSEYEELRSEYEELRRPFNNYMKLTDVLKFSQQTHITGKWKHPTMKPPQLCSALIRTCSRKGMNMLVPFGGSGSECIEGFHAGLNVVSSELDKDYFDMAQQRILEETAQLSLF